jgi:hypothetical protein
MSGIGSGIVIASCPAAGKLKQHKAKTINGIKVKRRITNLHSFDSL